MANSNQVKSGYVKDSAGTVWYAVSRDQAGGFNAFTTFYSDIRCDPATVGTPAPGQLLPAEASSSGGGVPANIATNDKLEELKLAIQSTAEDDQTQGILNTLVNEANDTQTLLSAMDTAIQNASDEAAVAKLEAVRVALLDTTEDDQTQVKLDALIAAVQDTTEDDQTQSALSNVEGGINLLKAQNLSESNETQSLLQSLLTYYTEGSSVLSFDSTVHTANHVIGIGNRTVFITNNGTKDITVAGGRVIPPGGSWGIEAGLLNKLPGITIAIDATDPSPSYTLDRLY